MRQEKIIWAPPERYLDEGLTSAAQRLFSGSFHLSVQCYAGNKPVFPTFFSYMGLVCVVFGLPHPAVD